YDRRGHGQSGVPKGPYSMGRLGKGGLGVLHVVKIKKTKWGGLLVGGMVGEGVGANAPDRGGKLRLCNTKYHLREQRPWNDRIKLVTEKGLDALVDTNMQRWFTEGFRKRAPEVIARMKKMFVATKVPGYVGCCEAICDMDFRASNPRIKAPTLVIVGAQDPATPPSAGEIIQKAIKGAKLASLDAAHISNMEQPKQYTDTVLNFRRG